MCDSFPLRTGVREEGRRPDADQRHQQGLVESGDQRQARICAGRVREEDRDRLRSARTARRPECRQRRQQCGESPAANRGRVLAPRRAGSPAQ